MVIISHRTHLHRIVARFRANVNADRPPGFTMPAWKSRQTARRSGYNGRQIMRSGLLLSLLVVTMSHAQNYTAQKTAVDGVEVVRLGDAARQTEVSMAPSIGNLAYAMTVKGKNVFWAPFRSLAELKAKPVQAGNPFLAPWANRLDQDAYYANGKKYLLNPELKNWRRDGNQKPIHGLLVFSPAWQVTRLQANRNGAEVTSRLEFWRYPDLMAQFPFAHAIQMTYRLREGALEVETLVENHAREPMPVSIGYHPYFQVHDAPRDQWKVHLAAREQVVLSNLLIPTGERRPVTLPDPVSLESTQLDDVFTNLVRDASGRAEFWVQGASQKVAVIYGPKYAVAVVYAPKGRGFICFEPMAAITNALNLAHAGVYKELQSIPPGGSWRESFWIRPSGF
jgi:aldose 1-epimerase